MRAAYNFSSRLPARESLPLLRKIEIELFGALSLSRKCHNVDSALYLGLMGYQPDNVDIRQHIAAVAKAEREHRITLFAATAQPVDVEVTIISNHHAHPAHPYAMTFRAKDDYFTLHEESWLSVGEGEVCEYGSCAQPAVLSDDPPPFIFHRAGDLLALCEHHRLSIAALMMKNEQHWHSPARLQAHFSQVWAVMQQAVHRGLNTEGVLPGPYQVPRRACALHKRLRPPVAGGDFLTTLNWVNAFAMAVSEENAAGGQIVTAPTNGSGGIVPAVLSWYDKFVGELKTAQLLRFFLTAGAVAMLFKRNASILGSEVGCQGEIGVACAMAAAGAAELMGASTVQVLNAAEIAMEHHLGLTCDPVGGQVQVPCIERNAISAIKAINAATMAMNRVSPPCLSLDDIIGAMFETGKDMSAKYRETYHGYLGSLQPGGDKREI